MGQMRSYRMTPLILAGALLAATCVPEPANRATPGASVASATRTPVPTPAGPTPTPSFVRPTPTPQPTFLVHTVVTGDSLEKIAKRYGTTALSIAYWNRVAYATLDPDSEGYDPDYLAIGWTLQLIPRVEVDPENLPPGRPTAEPLVSAEPSPGGG
jgi:nucleoid-associated protein YgaU